jgi:peptide/nickel transport system substrate-binding protein
MFDGSASPVYHVVYHKAKPGFSGVADQKEVNMRATLFRFIAGSMLMLCAVYGFAGGQQEGGDQAANQEDSGEVEQTLVGAFEIGPGGNQGAVSIPFAYGAGHTVTSKMYTGLTIFDSTQQNIEPHAAASWQSNEDATVWTFTLREDLMWSDGEQVTADDVKFTAEFISGPGFTTPNVDARNLALSNVVGFDAMNNGEAESMEGVRVIDDRTVAFELTQPDYTYFGKVTRFYLLPEHAVDFEPGDYMETDWWTDPERQVGSGPFSVADFAPDDFLALAANEHYMDGRPRLNRLIVQYFGGDATAATAALSAGDIHFSFINQGDIRSLGEDFQIFDGLSNVPRFLIVQYRNVPDFWRDPRVRYAILHAIDRQTIVDTVYDGSAEVIPGFLPWPETWTDSMNWYEYDPDRARELLSEVGISPEDIEISQAIGYQSDPTTLSAMQAIEGYLRELGISFSYQAYDTPTYLSFFNPNEFEFSYKGAGMVPYTRDPSFMFTNEGRLGGQKYDFDFDSIFGDAIEAIQTARTPEEYMAANTRFNELTNETQSRIFLWVQKAFGAANPNVGDFHWYPAAGGGPYQDHPERWFISE